MPVTVTVRDGRDGRDSSEVGGQILMVLKRDKPIDVGEFLGLPDGSLRRVAQSRTLGREGSQPVGYGRRPVYKAHSQFKVSLRCRCRSVAIRARSRHARSVHWVRAFPPQTPSHCWSIPGHSPGWRSGVLVRWRLASWLAFLRVLFRWRRGFSFNPLVPGVFSCRLVPRRPRAVWCCCARRPDAAPGTPVRD